VLFSVTKRDTAMINSCYTGTSLVTPYWDNVDRRVCVCAVEICDFIVISILRTVT